MEEKMDKDIERLLKDMKAIYKNTDIDKEFEELVKHLQKEQDYESLDEVQQHAARAMTLRYKTIDIEKYTEKSVIALERAKDIVSNMDGLDDIEIKEYTKLIFEDILRRL